MSQILTGEGAASKEDCSCIVAVVARCDHRMRHGVLQSNGMANAWQTRGKFNGHTWQLHGSCTPKANAWQLFGNCTAIAWHMHSKVISNCMANARQLRGNCMPKANAWQVQLHCSCIANAWQMHGKCIASA